MSTTVINISNFSQSSSWNVTYNGSEYTYGTPSTSTLNKTFSMESIPDGDTIDTAVLTATYGSPYTGAAVRKVEGVTFSGTKDVKSLITKTAGNYNNLVLEFKFKANGGEGGAGIHTSSLAYSNVKITITHHAPGSTLSLSATTTPSDANVTATITPADAAYAHKIKLSLGTHAADAPHTYSLTHGNNTQVISFPGEWLDVIPSGTSTTGKVTLETYTGDTYATLLASTDYSITVTVPAASAPTITSFAATIVNAVADFNDNTIGRYVKGYSKVKLDVDCEAIDGAHIVSVYISGDDINGTPTLADGVYSLTTEKLTSAKLYTCTARVTDSRQRFITQNVTFTVQDYAPPAVSSASIYRSNSDGTHNASSGTYMTVNAVLAWSSVDGQNAVTATLFHRQSGVTEWTSNGAISSGVNKIVSGISADYVYNVKIVITDKVADGSDYPANVASSEKALDLWENKGAAFFMRAYRDGVEVKPGKPLYYQGQDLDERFNAAATVAKIETLANDAREAMEVYFDAYYTDPSQFGVSVTDSTTLSDLVSQMPVRSILWYTPATSATGNVSPSNARYGSLVILKLSDYRCHCLYYPNGNADVYDNWVYYNSGTSSYDAGSWEKAAKNIEKNSSTSSQSGFSSDAYLSGSYIKFPVAPKAGTTYKLVFDLTKTAAGTATPIIKIRIGTAGTTSDATLCTLTFGAGTTVADTGLFEVIVTFRSVGSGTAAVIQSIARLTSNLTTAGISNAVKAVVVTSGGFESTTSGLGIGASYNGGTSASHTVQLVHSELMI